MVIFSVDETLIPDGTNFVTTPVTSIQNYSLPKLAAVHAILSNELEMAEIGSGAELYSVKKKNM